MPVSEGPDPTHPDQAFRDSQKRVVCVDILPDSCPVILTYGEHFSLEEAFFAFLVTLARRRWRRIVRKDLDKRLRVVVSRHPRRPGLWRTLYVEFVDNEVTAEARRVEILQTWDDGRWSSTPPLGARERERLRRASRDTGKPLSRPSRFDA